MLTTRVDAQIEGNDQWVRIHIKSIAVPGNITASTNMYATSGFVNGATIIADLELYATNAWIGNATIGTLNATAPFAATDGIITNATFTGIDRPDRTTAYLVFYASPQVPYIYSTGDAYFTGITTLLGGAYVGPGGSYLGPQITVTATSAGAYVVATTAVVIGATDDETQHVELRYSKARGMLQMSTKPAENVWYDVKLGDLQP